MIGIFSTHERVIVPVRRAADRAGRQVHVLSTPQGLHTLAGAALLVVDAATGALFDDTASAVVAFHQTSPNTRIVVQMLAEEGNREMRLLLALMRGVPAEHIETRAPEELSDDELWDSRIGQVEHRLEQLREGMRMVFVAALMRVPRPRGKPLDTAIAKTLVALLDDAPKLDNVASLAHHSTPTTASVNAARQLQNRAWRRVFGAHGVSTGTCLVLFKLLWYKYLRSAHGYDRLEACRFLRLEEEAFTLQIKRRTGLSRREVDGITLTDMADWIAKVCVMEYHGVFNPARYTVYLALPESERAPRSASR